MTDPSKLQVLVCPLDWGLGHASRCIPVIQRLISKGHEVTIAASGRSLALLKLEFPNLVAVEFPGFSPEYSANGTMTLKMVGLIPLFIKNLFVEHSELKKLILQLRIDVVISDNRYGLWNKNVKSILIIHQLNIQAPPSIRFLEPFLFLINRVMMGRFNECWIPDFPGPENLSGKLSHSRRIDNSSFYVGPLSRFIHEVSVKATEKNEILVILSGPEPQRNILEDKILAQLKNLTFKAVVICGKPEAVQSKVQSGRITIMVHATTTEMEEFIRNSELVICRSGYTTIMDLAAIGGKALFIPTPGQTEQEYLAHIHKQNGSAWYVSQNDLDLSRDIPAAMSVKGFVPIPDAGLLGTRIEMITNK